MEKKKKYDRVYRGGLLNKNDLLFLKDEKVVLEIGIFEE